MKRFVYDLAENEIATLLGALRYYQHSGLGNPENQPSWFAEIVTNGGEFVPLNGEEIDDLCEKLNLEGEPLS